MCLYSECLYSECLLILVSIESVFQGSSRYHTILKWRFNVSLKVFKCCRATVTYANAQNDFTTYKLKEIVIISIPIIAHPLVLHLWNLALIGSLEHSQDYGCYLLIFAQVLAKWCH